MSVYVGNRREFATFDCIFPMRLDDLAVHSRRTSAIELGGLT
jgi:hypothetical protein